MQTFLKQSIEEPNMMRIGFRLGFTLDRPPKYLGMQSTTRHYVGLKLVDVEP